KSVLLLFSLHRYGHYCHLLSFPTRRSSDLPPHVTFNSIPFNTIAPTWKLTTRILHSISHEVICLKLDQLSYQTISTMTGLSPGRSEEHTSELQSRENLVCRLLLEKKKMKNL